MSREIDAQIAKHVMGWKNFGESGWAPPGETPSIEYTETYGGTQFVVPHYSTDIAAAWSVVEKLHAVWDIRNTADGWEVRVVVQMGPYSDKIVEVEASTAPEAICLAALRAVGGDQ